MSGKGPEKHAVVLNRPPKGHRQRGAGTVIVSKPPVLTDDGILLKPFERLPTTLLQEFSQRERRIMPKYNQCRRSSDDDEEDTDAAAKYKFEVHLEDKKNSKFDLKFTPNQSFSSEKVAKVLPSSFLTIVIIVWSVCRISLLSLRSGISRRHCL